MPAPQIKLTRRQLYAVGSVGLIIVIIIALIFSYPWLQLQMGNLLMNNARYEQAEQLLAKLAAKKPNWTEPQYKLVLAQLQLGKAEEAARTVLSLAEQNQLDSIELAVLFMDVGLHLVNSGNSNSALELTQNILAEQNEKMFHQAAIEVGQSIAEVSQLPLAMDAVELILELEPDNWLLDRKAFNILLSKALVSPARHARPALERALDIFPYNTLAVTQLAKIIGEQESPQSALDFLLAKEAKSGTIPINQEYVSTKRKLVFQLATDDTTADLTPYIQGLSDDMLTEMALDGLSYARRHNRAGEQFYQLQPDNANVAYQFGRNLFTTHQWQEARDVFAHLRSLSPEHANFDAVFAAIDFQLKTEKLVLDGGQFTIDLGLLSPAGEYVALRRWVQSPWVEDMSSELVIKNLRTNQHVTRSDAYLFGWSASGNYLAYLGVTENERGRLQLHHIDGDETIELPEEYDVMFFNWVGDTLMVQAVLEDGSMALLHLSAPQWEDTEPLPWPEITSAVNHQLAWLAMEGQRYFTVYQHGRDPQRITVEANLLKISDWSPNGNYAVIEAEGDRYYMYDHNRRRISPIETAGQFAGWAGNSQVYWYYPVWGEVYVLARLNTAGSVQEYLPYTFTQPVYDMSIASQGRRVLVSAGEELIIYTR